MRLWRIDYGTANAESYTSEYFGTRDDARARITALRVEHAKDNPQFRITIVPQAAPVPTTKAQLIQWLNKYASKG